MSEKYKILFQPCKDLYLESSPVLIKAGALVLDNETARVHIQLKFQNLCEKKIASLKAKIILMDTIGRKIGGGEKLYLDINAKKGEEFGSNIPVPIADSTSRQFKASVSEICFTDGTVWNNEDLNWEPLPSLQSLNDKFTTSEARDEFKSLYCKKAEYLPFRYKDLWFCSCGNINKNPQEKCFYCGAKLSDMESADNESLTKNNIYRNATTLVSKNTSSEIKEGIALFERIVDWKDSKQKLEKANAKIIEVKQREQKALEEKEKQKKKRKRNIIISAIGVLALITVIVIINFIAKANRYEEAVALFEDYQYKEAAYLFDSLKGYKDADLYYEKAICLYNEKYEDAVKNYGIKEIRISDDKNSIPKEAFKDYTTLEKIIIHNKVTDIGANAFENCSAEIVWEENSLITVIGEKAFYGYKGTSITIPDRVTEIGDYAFYDCDSLTSVVIGNNVTSIGDKAFYSCNSLTSVVIGNSVTSIGDETFSYCYRLTSVVIGNSVTSIGDRAFYDCNSLTSVVIGNNVTSIGDKAFCSCNSLTSVAIPDSVTLIGDRAFYDCDSLTSVVIGNNVTSIGDETFAYCDSLTSVVIPDSVTSIGIWAFYGCDSLTSITFKDSSTWHRTTSSTDWKNKTGGTATNVTNASTNATYFKSTYDDYYWYKK